MKKFAKLSLVAAVAVAGLTTANAASLEEAIKNVDITGTATYRYNDYENSDASQNQPSNNYKVAVSLKSKVNDDVTFNSRFIAGDGTSPVSLNTSTTGDSNVDITLTEANFTYTGIENTSITLGKQGLATPFTVARDSMGGESTGTGVLAITTMGPVSAAAGYFNQTNLTGLSADGENLVVAGLMGKFAGINVDAWYGDVDDVANVYTVGLSANYTVSDINLSSFVRYSEQDEDANSDDISALKVGVSANMGIFSAFLGYGESGKDGYVALDGNSSATTFDEHWRVGLFADDAEIIFANVGAQVTDTVNVALKHSNLDSEVAGEDKKETYVQVLYSMSSNLYTYVRFGEYKAEGDDAQTSGRVQVGYSF